jgi:hypothetical protein
MDTVIVVASKHIGVPGSWSNYVELVIPAMARSASEIAPKRFRASKATCPMAGRPPRALGAYKPCAGRGIRHAHTGATSRDEATPAVQRRQSHCGADSETMASLPRLKVTR